MAIAGIGIDVVQISRFEAALARVPRLAEKLFTPIERDQPIRSLAARFAAKEAVAKAMGSPGQMLWHDCEIPPSGGKTPQLIVRGSVAAAAANAGIARWHLSLSHDGDIATAMVVAEGAGN